MSRLRQSVDETSSISDLLKDLQSTVQYVCHNESAAPSLTLPRSVAAKQDEQRKQLKSLVQSTSTRAFSSSQLPSSNQRHFPTSTLPSSLLSRTSDSGASAGSRFGTAFQSGQNFTPQSYIPRAVNQSQSAPEHQHPSRVSSSSLGSPQRRPSKRVRSHEQQDDSRQLNYQLPRRSGHPHTGDARGSAHPSSSPLQDNQDMTQLLLDLDVFHPTAENQRRPASSLPEEFLVNLRPQLRAFLTSDGATALEGSLRGREFHCARAKLMKGQRFTVPDNTAGKRLALLPFLPPRSVSISSENRR